jgi:hypothetical protein
MPKKQKAKPTTKTTTKPKATKPVNTGANPAKTSSLKFQGNTW